MTFRQRAFLILAALAALCCADIAVVKDPIVNQAAPDFQVTTIDGNKPSLVDFKGQLSVLNFWATWCVPCK
jgi:thiol-disulfide isomerase/thioredoxin